MQNNNYFGRYINGDSIIHNMNANIKILCVIVFLLLNVLANNLLLVTVLFIMTMVWLMLTRITLKKYIKSLWHLRIFLIFILIINLLLKSNFSEIVIPILKLSTLLMYSTSFILTTKIKDIEQSIIFVLTPLKIFNFPVNKTASLVNISLKIIPALHKEGINVINALYLRGVRFNTKKDKISSSKFFVIPMLIKSLKKAENLGDELELNSYDLDNIGFEKKTILRFSDVYLLVMHFLILAVILAERVII